MNAREQRITARMRALLLGRDHGTPRVKPGAKPGAAEPREGEQPEHHYRRLWESAERVQKEAHRRKRKAVKRARKANRHG